MVSQAKTQYKVKKKIFKVLNIWLGIVLISLKKMTLFFQRITHYHMALRIMPINKPFNRANPRKQFQIEKVIIKCKIFKFKVLERIQILLKTKYLIANHLFKKLDRARILDRILI